LNYRFVDCRFDLLSPGRGEELYLEGHIPGASFMDLDRDLSDASRAPEHGRHPLPSAGQFSAAASRAGIGEGVFVVAYDQGMAGGAARLWWLLHHFGHREVAVLEGGIEAWRGPLASGPERFEPVEFLARTRAGDTIEAEELLTRLGDAALTILDARSPERFRGDSTDDPIAVLDPVPGHIPGARNLHHARSRQLPADVLEAGEIVAYCGSGVTACIDLLRLAEAGRPDARLYAGSWSEWARRGLPVEKSAPATDEAR
jgi:thiosulfate/3-mercaptopyruvate sulfurtransferase